MSQFFVGVLSTLLFLASAGSTQRLDSVPKHVLTWAYDGGYGGMTDGASATATNPTSQRHIQTWLSFAEAGIQRNGHPQKAFYDCPEGAPCKNVVYYNPVKLFSTCWPDSLFISANTDEDFYLHDEPGKQPSNRTSQVQMACGHLAQVYYPNWTNPAVGQWFARNYLGLIPENKNTIMFQDSSAADCRGRFHSGERYAPSELQGGPDCETSLAKALRNVADQMQWQDGTPVLAIANGLGLVRVSQVANTASVKLLAPGSHIIGGVEENDEIFAKRYTPRAVFGDVNTASLAYATNPKAMYGFNANSNAVPGSTNSCVDVANNIEDQCGALQLRRDMLASFWLAFKPGNTILWENFNFSGNACCGGAHSLAVYPEASIYPTKPVQSLQTFSLNVPTTDGSGCGSDPGRGGIQSFVVACGTLNDGKTPAGVYVREFRDCYNFGELVGAGQCAVVMNATNKSVQLGSWFSLSYNHSMTLGSGPTNGSDVLTAGCGDQRCPTAALDPLGASIDPRTAQVSAFDAVFLFHD